MSSSIIFNWLKYGKLTNKASIKKWHFFILQAFLELLIAFVISKLGVIIFLTVLEKLLHLKLLDFTKPNLASFIAEIGLNKYYLLVGLIGPIHEELMYRAPLNMSKKTILFSSFLIVFYIFAGDKVFGGNLFYLSTFIIICLLIILSLFNSKQTLKVDNKKYPIYLSSGLFALFHISNFFPIVHTLQIVLMPLTLLPFFVGGILFSIIRIEKGIIFSILVHIIFNLFTLIIKHQVRS